MGTQSFEEMIAFYHNVFVYCGIAAIVFLLLAVALFFWLKIPQVFAEYTGRKAQKAIDEMTAENASSGSLGSGKIDEAGRRRRKGRTGSLATSRLRQNQVPPTPVVQQPTFQQNVLEPTAQPKFQQNALDPVSQPAAPMDDFSSQETDVLDDFGSQPTDVLSNFDTQSTEEISLTQPTVQPTIDDTMPIYQGPESETMVLDQSLMNTAPKGVFVIERSIVEIHTDEVI